MTRLRIVCKVSKSEQPKVEPGMPRIGSIIPSWSDMQLFLVDDDGQEHPIDNVNAVTFKAQAGTDLPVAVVEFVDVEIDAVAEVVDPIETLRALGLQDADTNQRGVGRTHCMLKAAVATPAEQILIIGSNEWHCDALRAKTKAILAESHLAEGDVDRFTFATLEEERTTYRGHQFDARFVDHAVVTDAIKRALG